MTRAGFARDDEITVDGRPARVLHPDYTGPGRLLVKFHDTGAVILVDAATAVKT